jgi:hypothetical protein
MQTIERESQCTCGHPVTEHHPTYGTCAEYPECDCETCSVGPDDREDLPLCVRAMGCLCAWHAVGAPVEDECDANEGRARRYAAEQEEA